jgi:hypothetical protein
MNGMQMVRGMSALALWTRHIVKMLIMFQIATMEMPKTSIVPRTREEGGQSTSDWNMIDLAQKNCPTT